HGSHGSALWPDQRQSLFHVTSDHGSHGSALWPQPEDLAVRLHAQFPEHYPDDSHKPEMAIALTPFRGLCGFRPVQEILDFLSDVPELLALVGPDSVQDLRSPEASDSDRPRVNLKNCFQSDDEDQQRRRSDAAEETGGKAELRGKTPAHRGELGLDVGATYIRNSEEAFLIPSLSLPLTPPPLSDCVEVMACSDNTVRAGLTPKFLDVETLCSMLDYSPGPAHSKLIQVRVPEGAPYTVAALDSGSVLLVVSGSARCPGHDDITLRRGAVLFLSANHSLPLKVTSSLELSGPAASCKPDALPPPGG
uniref:Mannose phosphate isomerase n=1 Tax=Neogobius melanostomus TaxID=47308 RepID=A0A8C6TPF7_9GOBI